MAVLELDEIPDDLDWTTRRTLVLVRDHYTCQDCGDSANHVDHKWPKSIGGTDELDNLQALCGPCNKAKGSTAYLAHLTDRQAESTSNHYVDRAVSAVLNAAEFLRVMHLIDEQTNGQKAYEAAQP